MECLICFVCVILVKVHATCRLFNFFQIKQHQDTKQHKAKTELKRTSGVLQKFLTPAPPASTSRPVSENDNVTKTKHTHGQFIFRSNNFKRTPSRIV